MKMKKGYTLVEISIVMVLIGVIAVVVTIAANRNAERGFEPKYEKITAMMEAAIQMDISSRTGFRFEDYTSADYIDAITYSGNRNNIDNPNGAYFRAGNINDWSNVLNINADGNEINIRGYNFLTTKDGATVAISNVDTTTFIDVNGRGAPNVVGRDILQFVSTLSTQRMLVRNLNDGAQQRLQRDCDDANFIWDPAANACVCNIMNINCGAKVRDVAGCRCVFAPCDPGQVRDFNGDCHDVNLPGGGGEDEECSCSGNNCCATNCAGEEVCVEKDITCQRSTSRSNCAGAAIHPWGACKEVTPTNNCTGIRYVYSNGTKKLIQNDGDTVTTIIDGGNLTNGFDSVYFLTKNPNGTVTYYHDSPYNGAIINAIEYDANGNVIKFMNYDRPACTRTSCNWEANPFDYLPLTKYGGNLKKSNGENCATGPAGMGSCGKGSTFGGEGNRDIIKEELERLLGIEIED